MDKTLHKTKTAVSQRANFFVHNVQFIILLEEDGLCYYMFGGLNIYLIYHHNG